VRPVSERNVDKYVHVQKRCDGMSQEFQALLFLRYFTTFYWTR